MRMLWFIHWHMFNTWRHAPFSTLHVYIIIIHDTVQYMYRCRQLAQCACAIISVGKPPIKNGLSLNHIKKPWEQSSKWKRLLQHTDDPSGSQQQQSSSGTTVGADPSCREGDQQSFESAARSLKWPRSDGVNSHCEQCFTIRGLIRYQELFIIKYYEDCKAEGHPIISMITEFACDQWSKRSATSRHPVTPFHH